MRTATAANLQIVFKPLFLMGLQSRAKPCSSRGMNPQRHRFRFFTKLIEEDGAAGHLWCWAKLDVAGRVVNSGSGFYTVVAAMRDARDHGFNGPADPGNADYVLAESGDRRSFAI